MDFIKNYIFSLCGASAVVSIAKLLLHNTKVSKTVNIFLSVFLLFYMVAPFGGKNTDIDFTEYSNGSSEEITVDYYYADFIILSVNKVCEETGTAAKSIEIIDRKTDGETVIDYIEIKLEDSDKADEIAEKLKRYYGFEVRVE